MNGPTKYTRRKSEEMEPLLSDGELSGTDRVFLYPELQSPTDSEDGLREPDQKLLEVTDISFERDLEHPTSTCDTMIHLLKGNIGTGILAMPNALLNSGLTGGCLGLIFMGIVCLHCMHSLVQCSHELCRRLKKSSMGYAEVAEFAFKLGPGRSQRVAIIARKTINAFLCITQLGFCCVYFVFVAANLKQVLDCHIPHIEVIGYMAIILLPMVLLCWIRNLKLLSPFSMIANVLLLLGVIITFYFILFDGTLPHTSSREQFAPWNRLPLYFGTAIYSFEGIGLVLPLENNMASPEDFGGFTGVLNSGMMIVICMYIGVGFYGYLKYGTAVAGSITLNLPVRDPLAQSVKLMMAAAIFLSYALQYYVAFDIMWPHLKDKLRPGKAQQIGEFAFRTLLVIFTFCLAAAIPNIGLFISLVGALSSSTLALIFPPIIEVMTFYPNLGPFKWLLIKNVLIALFGLLGFLTGSYASIYAIVDHFISPDTVPSVGVC